MAEAALHPRSALLRVLGLVFGLAVVVGGVIGSGIMRAPGLVAQGIHGPGWIMTAWAAGGVLSIIAAMPLVEAGASVAKAGGAFPIAERAFGRTAGLFTGWIAWLQYAAANAFIAAVFGEYAHRLGLATAVPEAALACGLILAAGLLNLAGTRLSGASQTVASAIKGAAFLALAAILLIAPHREVAAPVAVTVGGAAALVMAVRVIYVTYAGWDGAIYFSEEVHRPERTLARATFLGIGLLTVLYLTLNAAVLHVLPVAAVAGSKLALGDAAKAVLGPVADVTITAIGLFSLAAIVNLQMMAAPRVTFRMAADGLLPAPLAWVAANGAPWASVLLLTAASALFAGTGTYESLVTLYAPWSMGTMLIIALASIALRWREPDLPRPWKMPLFPLPAILAAGLQAALIGLSIWEDPKAGAVSIAVALAPLALSPFILRVGRRK